MPAPLKRLLAALVLGVALLGGCVSTPRPEASITAFYEHINESAVVVGYEAGGSLNFIGSGAIVGVLPDGRWLGLTARHVVEHFSLAPNWKGVVGDPKTGDVYGIEVLTEYKGRFASNQDFAFFAVDGGDFDVLPLTDEAPRLGERVFIASQFPWGTTCVFEGRIAAIEDRATLAIIDCSVSFGYSGSPVIDELGRCVGVVIAVQVYPETRPPIPVAGSGLIVVIAGRS